MSSQKVFIDLLSKTVVVGNIAMDNDFNDLIIQSLSWSLLDPPLKSD